MKRISSLAFVASLVLMASPAAAQCPESALLNYDGGGAVTCPCFVVGEEAGVVLQAPAGAYPIEITKIRVGWSSQFGGNPQSLEQALHLYAGGLPNPGAPQFSLPGPLLTDGAINEFNIEFTPGNKIIAAGPFTVTLEFANQNAGNVFASSVFHDGNGCQGGENVVFAIPGGWADACLLGVTGDWVFEVDYRSVNCASVPSMSEGAVAVMAILALGMGAFVLRRSSGA